MKLKFEGFFNKKNESCVKTPKINTGSVNINYGGCYDNSSISVTVPHITTNDKTLAKDIAKEHTYTLKF